MDFNFNDPKKFDDPQVFNDPKAISIGGIDLDKNGHILPTGQWYAPSAVINDALIMPEYARACQSMPE